MQVGYKHGGEKLHFQIKCRDGKVKRIVKSTLKHPLQGLQPRRQRQSFRWPPSLQGEGLTEWLAILTNAGENTPSPPVNAAGREKRRCKREIVFEPSQEVQAEAKFWGYFAMSPSLMSPLTLAVSSSRTHAYVHVRWISWRRRSERRGALQRGGDRRSLWKSEHKRAASRGLWKGHKGRTSLWHGALSPGWPSDTDTAASKPLATEPEQRAGTRMADHKRLPGFFGVERSKAFWEMDEVKSSDMNEFMRGVKFKHLTLRGSLWNCCLLQFCQQQKKMLIKSNFPNGPLKWFVSVLTVRNVHGELHKPLWERENNVSSEERKGVRCRHLAYRGSVTRPGYVVVLWDESVGVGGGLVCLG